MPRATRNAKNVKMTYFKPRDKKQKAGSRSMAVFTATKTRRGKTVYKEEDAAPYYALSDEEGESSKTKPSKTPSCLETTIPASLENTWEVPCLDDQEPYIPRTTKVRLRL